MGYLEVRGGDLGTLASQQICELCHRMSIGMSYAGSSGLVIRDILAQVMICGEWHVKCELFPEGQLGVDIVWEERVELLSVG